MQTLAILVQNPSECQLFHLFRCVLSSLLPLQSVGRSNFDKGLHNLITLIQKRHKIMIETKLLYCIMESTVDSYEKRNTIYIYIYINLFICNTYINLIILLFSGAITICIKDK